VEWLKVKALSSSPSTTKKEKKLRGEALYQKKPISLSLVRFKDYTYFIQVLKEKCDNFYS
jgi:hypothetical protein